jgi:hypothetical protein
MLVTGDIKCLHCGFISGRWVGPGGAPLTPPGYQPKQPQPAGEPQDPSALLRCARCEGPVFLDDVDPVISSTRLRRIRRLREQIAAIDAHRRDAA